MSVSKKEAYIKASAIPKKDTSAEDDIVNKVIEKVYPSQQSKPSIKISIAHDCNDCMHCDVCKYKEDTENFHIDLLPNITIDCKYYKENE